MQDGSNDVLLQQKPIVAHLLLVAFNSLILVWIVLLIDLSQVSGVGYSDDLVVLSVDDQHLPVESYYLGLVIEVLLYDAAQTPKEVFCYLFYCIEGRD